MKTIIFFLLMVASPVFGDLFVISRGDQAKWDIYDLQKTNTILEVSTGQNQDYIIRYRPK